MPRAIWSGSISFGLVNIPVKLYSAVSRKNVQFNQLDARSNSRVKQKRVSADTGEEVPWEQIVKGYEYRKGEYVALNEEDFRQANVEASKTIDIVSFAERSDIPPEFYETPYFLAPAEGGEKTYALLREAMRGGEKVAIGSFVIRGRQHFCAILAQERALLLNTLRFAEELVPAGELELPPANAGPAKVSAQELAMARKLIEEMSGTWKPQAFKDTYRQDLMRRIKEKIRKRQTHVLTPIAEPEDDRPTAEIIDLMAVLRKSLKHRGGTTRSRREAA